VAGHDHAALSLHRQNLKLIRFPKSKYAILSVTAVCNDFLCRADQTDWCTLQWLRIRDDANEAWYTRSNYVEIRSVIPLTAIVMRKRDQLA
jgi:hypothetical protein